MNYLNLGLLMLGILARLGQYFYNRPFWGDELALIENLTSRSFAGLLQPLDNVQAAPIGFLWLSKLSLTLFGDSTYSLRLVPLIAGIVSLFLFWALAQRLAPRAVPLALGLFISSNWLIYYANETKQYSLDLLLTLALLLAFSYRVRPVFLAIGGAVAVWCSHPVIFVLAAIGFVWLRTESQRRTALFVGAVWLLSFGAAYIVMYSNTAANDALLQYWREIEPSFISSDPITVARAMVNTLLMISGLHQPALFIVAAVGMIYGINRANASQRILFLLPAVLVAGAAALEKYPYSGRFILFLIPGLTLITAIGLTDILQNLSLNRRVLYAVGAVCLLALPLLNMDVTQGALFR